MMQSLVQFSVFLANKPTVLAQVCRELGKSRINIVAMTMMDATEHGVLRLIPEDASKARPVLRQLNIPMTETEVLAVPMTNRPGSLADICERLSNAHIHISYMYCTTGARNGKALGVFKVANIARARKVIETRNNKRRDMTVKLRRPRAVRK